MPSLDVVCFGVARTIPDVTDGETALADAAARAPREAGVYFLLVDDRELRYGVRRIPAWAQRWIREVVSTLEGRAAPQPVSRCFR
jgi:hypothetical protein